MTYYARINAENVVVQVGVFGEGDVELPQGGWVEVTKREGKRQAGVGFRYMADKQGFQSPQPFASWSFNEDEWQWEPPVPMPADNKPYVWNEDKGAWEELA